MGSLFGYPREMCCSPLFRKSKTIESMNEIRRNIFLGFHMAHMDGSCTFQLCGYLLGSLLGPTWDDHLLKGFLLDSFALATGQTQGTPNTSVW